MLRRAVASAITAALALLAIRSQPAVASEADQDAQVIAELTRAGSDLTRPHAVDFYLYFRTRDAADDVAKRLAKHGYGVTVRAAGMGNMPWLLLATRSMLVSVESIGQSTKLLRAEAARHRGDYDGWETGVVK